MFITDKGLEEFDPELWQSISKESVRQEEHIELIASENYTSKGILEIQGSVLTNKYSHISEILCLKIKIYFIKNAITFEFFKAIKIYTHSVSMNYSV